MNSCLDLNQVCNSLLAREGFRESRSCSRDTSPKSHITEDILIYEENRGPSGVQLAATAGDVRGRVAPVQLMNFVHHSTLGLRVVKNKKESGNDISLLSKNCLRTRLFCRIIE